MGLTGMGSMWGGAIFYGREVFCCPTRDQAQPGPVALKGTPQLSLPNEAFCADFHLGNFRSSSARRAQPQPLIYGQSQNPEHQVSHHLGWAADPDVTRAEFVLQARVHPLAHGPLFITFLLGPG